MQSKTFRSLKNSVIILLIGFDAGLGYSQISIPFCQEKARANYPLIKQYDLISKSTEYTLSNAARAYLPQISVTGIGAYIFKGFPSVTLPGGAERESEKFQFIGIGQINQTVWDGGATRAQKDITRAAAETEEASIDVALQAITERVDQLYFGILIIDEQVKQLNIIGEMTKRNLNAITISKNNGLAYQTDVDELKAELLKIDQRKIEFSFSRKGYTEMLSYLIAQPLAEDVSLEKPVISDSVTNLPINRPELSLYSRQRKLSTAQYSLNKVYNMPKIGLLGAAILVEPGTSFGTESLSSLALGGVSVSWNTAGIYKSANNNQLEKLQQEKIASQEEAFRFTTNLQLRQIRSDIEKQRALLAKDDEIVALKIKIRKAYELKYETGMGTMNDVIEATNKESEARSLQALHNIQLLMFLNSYQTTSGN